MKNLRQKLIIIISSIALLAVANVVITLWSVIQWQLSNKKLTKHYQSSLLLNTIQANIFLAFKEPYDALAKADDNAFEDFKEYTEPIGESFREWAKVMKGHPQEQSILKIEDAYTSVLRDAEKIFGMVEQKKYKKALEFMENQMELDSMPTFTETIQKNIEKDRREWAIISEKMNRTRELAQLILAIITISSISLVFLITAYLMSDLFAPLRKLKEGLGKVAGGNLQFRLEEERGDELGEINAAFNKMTESLEARKSLFSKKAPVNEDIGTDTLPLPPPPNTPLSRLNLQKLIFRLRSQLIHLMKRIPSQNNDAVHQSKKQILGQVNQLLDTISNLTEFSCPLELNLSQTNIRLMIHQMLVRFQPELIKKRVNISMEIDTQLEDILVDSLKFRQSLGELVQNALLFVPEDTGNIEIGARRSDDGSEFMIYVEDNRPKMKNGDNMNLAIGIKLAKTIVEQHGGELILNEGPKLGIRAKMILPIL